ncbi:methyltransferase domain-containing protein [Pedobacter sp. JCM 36344]|uniref:methyltransferase domain-containing protein n=1 Tax=Pedobacter sp. JCM 36344 TaxID=3374280 RepID=UPI003978ADD8
MFVDTKFRSNADEIMDDFALEGEILSDALDKIAGINRILGGNKVTIEGLEWLLSRQKRGSEISILDVGCGNGDMLRALAGYGKAKGLKFQLTGMDANAFTVDYAISLSKDYDNISYVCADIFDEVKQARHYDVILCTLTLHHFKDDEILKLVTGFRKQAIMGVVINDLHRSRLAYYLFIAVCKVFRLNKMSKDDGLVSILRGFKMDDIMNYADRLNIDKHILRWRWAFRYQWIIPTI